MTPEVNPELHPHLQPFAFLLGTWRGAGVGGYPTIEAFNFGQEITFSQDGKPVLAYRSRSWLLDPETGRSLRPLATETGFWRVSAAQELEVVLVHPTGFAEVWVGRRDGQRIELHTDLVARTATAKEVTAGHRLYGLVDDELMWAYDMAAVGQPLQPHLSARLRRVDD